MAATVTGRPARGAGRHCQPNRRRTIMAARPSGSPTEGTMDRNLFDELARTLAARSSRRRGLRALVGVALGGLIGPPGLIRPVAEAATVCRGLGRECRRDSQCCWGRCRRSRCRCPAGSRRVDDRCAPVCNDACAASASCRCALAFDGRRTFCSAPVTDCDGVPDECASHADCGGDALCIVTSCGPSGQPANRCVGNCWP